MLLHEQGEQGVLEARRAHTHTRIQADTHPPTHTHTHTYKRTPTHKQTPSPSPVCWHGQLIGKCAWAISHFFCIISVMRVIMSLFGRRDWKMCLSLITPFLQIKCYEFNHVPFWKKVIGRCARVPSPPCLFSFLLARIHRVFFWLCFILFTGCFWQGAPVTESHFFPHHPPMCSSTTWPQGPPWLRRNGISLKQALLPIKDHFCWNRHKCQLRITSVKTGTSAN